MTSPLILTLKLDQATFQYVDTLRQRHFPPERNFIPAHVTLFHALPGEQDGNIELFLKTLCGQTSQFSLRLPRLRFLGRGVAIEIDSPDLVEVRGALAREWNLWLSAQDRQGYRPHITVQNKVASTDARQLYEQLKDGWHPREGQGEGLLLWYYRGGPWELVNEFSFARCAAI